jgi:cell division GTPase FtsZ
MIDDPTKGQKSSKRQKEKRVLVLAIGGGGGRVLADLLKGSEHFRKLVSSVYFLNTNEKDLDEIFEIDLKKLEGEYIDVIAPLSGKKPDPDLIPVRRWWYGHTGAGGDFVRSRRMILYWLFSEKYKEELTQRGLTAEEVEAGELKAEVSFKESEKFSAEAQDTMNVMKREIMESDMILLIHSLGGGTGGGGTPILARYLGEQGKSGYMEDRTIVSLCFLADLHEEALTKANSVRNLMETSKYVDMVFLFSNENLIRQIRKEEIIREDTEKKTVFRELNSQIVNAVEILTTAMYEDKITKPLDFHDLHTFSLGLPANIIIPFLAPDHHGHLKLVCLDRALDFPLVSICNDLTMKVLPILVSNKPGIENIDAHPKGMYEEILSKKLMVDMREYTGDVRGVLDNDGGDPLKALVLGFALADLRPYLNSLDIAAYQWEAFHEEAMINEPKETTRAVINEIKGWYREYQDKTEEFVGKRKGGIK